jgi:hypothetical protein
MDICAAMVETTRDKHKTYLTPDADELADAEVFIQKRPKKDIVSDYIKQCASDRAYGMAQITRVQTVQELGKELICDKVIERASRPTTEEMLHAHLKTEPPLDTKCKFTGEGHIVIGSPPKDADVYTSASPLPLDVTNEQLLQLVDREKFISEDPASQELIRRWEGKHTGSQMAKLLGRSKSAVNKWRVSKHVQYSTFVYYRTQHRQTRPPPHYI